MSFKVLLTFTLGFPFTSPPIEKKLELLFLGEHAASTYSRNETTIHNPKTGQNHTVHIAWGVNSPSVAGQAVVDYVWQLTDRAERLLKRVLEFDSRIPSDIQQEIRDWEQWKMHYGWVRWLRYATVIRDRCRFENYLQKAATALWESGKPVAH